MQKDRGADIKNIQVENKKLEQQTQKMVRQLQKIKLFKQKQLEKQIKRQQQYQKESSNPVTETKKQVKKTEITKLNNYGAEIAKHHEARVKKELKKIVLPDSSQSQKEEQQDGQNLKYLLQIMGMQQYFEAFKANKVLSLAKLRNLKEGQIKAIGIPIKDHVKLIKKIREMGF